MNKPSLVDYIKDNFLYRLNKNIDFSHYDTNSVNESGSNALMFVLSYAQSFDLKINNEQFDYLAKNTDLLTRTHYNESVFTLAHRYKFETPHLMTDEYWSIFVNSIYTASNEHNADSADTMFFTTKYLVDNINPSNELPVLKRDSFSLLWNHLKEKDWFIFYLESKNTLENNIFISLLHTAEIQSYKEKKQLEAITETSNIGQIFKV